jgi:hypothetical protein
MDSRSIVTAHEATFEARRDELVARAAREREAVAQRLAPLGNLGGGFDRFRAMRSQLATLGVGAGLGLTALLLALPTGRIPLIRGGIALLHLAGYVRRLLGGR